MSDYNCNALRFIAVSDNLTQKLLAIPATAKDPKKPVVIPFRYIVTAASMALVFILSVSAIFFFRNKESPVVPSLVVKETAAEKGNENTAPSVSVTEGSGASPTVLATQPSSQPPAQIATDSEGYLIITTITEIITQYGAEPAEPDTPAEPAENEENPDQLSDQPREQATEQATSPLEPQTDPPYYPTPTEKVAYYEQPEWDLIQDVYVDIPADRLEGVEKIYCAIFSKNGFLFGNEDLFSPSRLAERKGESDGFIRIVYNPYENGIEINTLYYVIYFYDENGDILNY